jgi:hypothetical protein
MTRHSSQAKSANPKLQGPGAGARIPDKPVDCAPNVDTWPILDEQVGNAPGPKSGARDKSRSRS